MAIEIGARAPEFTLPNQFGEPIELRRLRGKRPVALVFFPLAFSGRCTSELRELRDNLDLFRHAGVELVGISVDSKFALRAWAEQEGYDGALLADFWPHGEVSTDYGVFSPDNGFADRATFIIDVDGIVRAYFTTAPGEVRPLAAYRAALTELQSKPVEAV